MDEVEIDIVDFALGNVAGADDLLDVEFDAINQLSHEVGLGMLEVIIHAAIHVDVGHPGLKFLEDEGFMTKEESSNDAKIQNLLGEAS